MNTSLYNRYQLSINHVLPVVLAIVLPGLSIYSNPGMVFANTYGYLLTWGITSTVLYYMWHLLWLVWDFHSGQKKWWFFIGLLILVLTLITISYLEPLRENEAYFWFNLLRMLLAGILMLAIQSAIQAQQNISSLLLEKEQIQSEQYRAQLKALQAQVDPHFLFNSLNTLRSMVRQQHKRSEEFVMSLSDFYRKTLHYNEHPTLPLSEELRVMQSYLFVMKSRNEEAVEVALSIEEQLSGLHLPTLALQVVIENCFKHNSMTSKKPLQIKIFNTRDDRIVIHNNRQPRIVDQDSSGLGLNLLRKRYELLGVSDGLLVSETEQNFEVKLKLLKPQNRLQSV